MPALPYATRYARADAALRSLSSALPALEQAARFLDDANLPGLAGEALETLARAHARVSLLEAERDAAEAGMRRELEAEEGRALEACDAGPVALTP